MKPRLNDTVRLTESLPQEYLAAGAIGVVVAEFTEPEEAYEIEFNNEHGETIAQIALRPTQFVVL